MTYVRRYAQPSRRMAKTITMVEVLSQSPQCMMQALTFGGMLVLCIALLDPVGLESGSPVGGILPLLGLFAVAGQRLIPELSRAYANATKLSFSAAAVDTVYRDLVERDTGTDLPGSAAKPPGLGEALELRGIGCRHTGSDRANLSNVNLRIEAGERIGIVGATGSGKSTLANVILGLLTPSEGTMVVDGDTVRAWQRSIGYVLQEIYLTDSSISENIALGIEPDQIDQDRVEHAARIARIDTFIRTDLPQGYATVVGERGVRLSGGQRQRIGIARAMYHDADLIVLDEATSALDSLTEKVAMEAIDGLPGDKTLVMIAHRLSTLRSCNRVIVLDCGHVATVGRWDDLRRDNAHFREMAYAQNA